MIETHLCFNGMKKQFEKHYAMITFLILREKTPLIISWCAGERLYSVHMSANFIGFSLINIVCLFINTSIYLPILVSLTWRAGNGAVGPAFVSWTMKRGRLLLLTRRFRGFSESRRRENAEKSKCFYSVSIFCLPFYGLEIYYVHYSPQNGHCSPVSLLSSQNVKFFIPSLFGLRTYYC